MMREVTDPNILAQLNGTSSGLKEVTDPAILAQLNGEVAPTPGLADFHNPQITKTAPKNPFFEDDPLLNFLGKTARTESEAAPVILNQTQQGVPLVGTFMDEAAGTLGGLGALAYDKATGRNLFKGANDAIGGGQDIAAKDIINLQQEKPVLSALSQLGSGLGLSAASLKNAPKIISSLRSSNLPARALQGGLAGAASGALYGLGAGEDGERLDNAGQTALLGGALGASIPAGLSLANAALGGVKRATGITKPIADFTAQEIKDIAGQSYQAAEDLGGILKPDITNKFIDKVTKEHVPTDELVNAAFKEKTPSSIIAENLAKDFRDKPITLKSAQAFDKRLGDAIDEHYSQGLSQEGLRLLKIRNDFRDVIDNATEDQVVGGKAGFDALKEGRKYWSQANKLRDIERIIERASMMEVPATGIKTGFRSLATNPARLRGYTEQEKSLIKEAAKTGIPTEVFRLMGSRLNPIIQLSTGHPLSAGVSWGTSLGGRKLAAIAQEGRANKVAKEVVGNTFDESTPKGALYKYLGKEKAESALAAITKGQVPDNLKNLPRTQARNLRLMVEKSNIPVLEGEILPASFPKRNLYDALPAPQRSALVSIGRDNPPKQLPSPAIELPAYEDVFIGSPPPKTAGQNRSAGRPSSKIGGQDNTIQASNIEKQSFADQSLIKAARQRMADIDKELGYSKGERKAQEARKSTQRQAELETKYKQLQNLIQGTQSRERLEKLRTLMETL